MKTITSEQLKQQLIKNNHVDESKLNDWMYYLERIAQSQNACLNCRGQKQCANDPQNYEVSLAYTSRPQMILSPCSYQRPQGPVTLYGIADKVFQQGTVDITSERAAYFDAEDQLLDALKGNFQGNPKGIALYGKFGTGKTYLIYHLCKELAGMGYSCDMVYYPDLVTEVNRCIKENTLESRIDEFKKVDVLFLDDVGAGQNTAYVRDNVLNSVLQERMNNQKLTFITSNCDRNALIDYFEDTKDSSDRLKAMRLVSWMESMMTFIELKGKDYRA